MFAGNCPFTPIRTSFDLNPTSEVKTADDADKHELGGETSRMSPKNAPQTKPFIIREIREIRGSYFSFWVEGCAAAQPYRYLW